MGVIKDLLYLPPLAKCTVDRVRIDAMLFVVGGILSVSGSLKVSSSSRGDTFRQLIVGSDGYDVIKWTYRFILVLGVTAVIIGLSNIVDRRVRSFDKYVAILVTLLFGNFAAGLVLTEYKNQLSDDLHSRMYKELRNIQFSRANLGVSYGLTEVWDIMQIQMLCCGVESHKDYTVKSGAKVKDVPTSCCVMKKKDGAMVVENPYQCQHDARLGFRESIFLHSKGCHAPLLSWFLRHVSILSGTLFGAICLQAFAILLLSWQGFVQAGKNKL